MKTFKEYLLESNFKIGFKWNTPDGYSEIVSYDSDSKIGIKHRTKDEADSRFVEFVDKNTLELLIKRDTANIEFREKQKAKDEIKAKEEAERVSLGGFEDTLSTIMKGKAKATLIDKQVGMAGKIFRSRRDAIQFLVNVEKRTIEIAKDGKRRLMHPDGYFFDEKDLTKLGMDYAEYLINKKH